MSKALNATGRSMLFSMCASLTTLCVRTERAGCS